jgi:hypothetical protein
MTPREWFILGIRLFGLYLITRGTTYVAAFADYKLALSESPRGVNPTGNLLYAAIDFALALYFLLGARHLAGFCENDDGGNGVNNKPEDHAGLEVGHQSPDDGRS